MRRITSLFLLLCLLSAMAVAAWGENPGIAYVSDEVGLLTPLQLQDLEEQAKALAQNEHFEVYIRILEDYSRNGSDSLFEYAIDFYDDNSLGYGKNHDGAMLLLSMADRDYWFDFNGSRSDIAFTETGRDAMEQEVLPYISRGDYYEGFREYLNLCQTYLAAEAEGDPIGYGTDHSETGYIE